MSKRVLGRGLSALLGEENSINSREELIEIDLNIIEPNSEQPRTTFAEDSLEELAQSIRTNGVVQPILVRRRGAKFKLLLEKGVGAPRK